MVTLHYKKVFLGGTCNESTWRDRLIPLLKIPFFNPIVSDWTAAAQKSEEIEKQICYYHLYCITPKMTGIYSIAELIDDSNKIPKQTLCIFLKSDDGVDFDEGQWKSLMAVSKMAQSNGATAFPSLEEAANFLNKML